jgi:hypothetical protein
MTRFGVPDDDMPEYLPPSGWGPASSDERDLDALLDGHIADVHDALRPVADVLVALRAAPALSELRGEANAMAEFRALGLGGTARPVRPAPTRPLSVLPADLSSPRGRRPVHRRRRRRRRAGRPVSRWAGVLTGVAAAAAIVVVVAFTGNLPGPIERIAHPSAAKPSASTAAISASPGVAKPSAKPHRTAHPSVSHSTAPAQPEAASTCRAFYGDSKYPQLPSRQDMETPQWQQLAQLAHENREPVYQYCARYVPGLFQHGSSSPGQYPAAPAAPGTGAGNQGNGQPGGPDGPAAPNGPAGGQQVGGEKNGSDGGFAR